MLSGFIEKQLTHAKYKLLEDGTYFGEIPLIQGCWANAMQLEDCRKELQEVLEEWMILKLRSGEDIPGLSLQAVNINSTESEDHD